MPMLQSGSRATPRLDLRDAFYEYLANAEDFAATKALPVLSVGKRDGAYNALTREYLGAADNNLHAKGASFARLDMQVEDKTYACKDYRQEGQLTNEDAEFYGDDFDAELALVRRLTNNAILKYEIRAKDALFNTNTFTGSTLFTDWQAAPWDAVGSDAILHVTTAAEKVRQNTGTKANGMLIGRATLINLLNNTGIKNRFPGAPAVTQKMIEDNLPAIFGLDKLYVGGAVSNGSKEGQTWTANDIWGDDYALVARFASDGQDLANPCVGRTFRWNKFNDENAVVTYWEDQTDSMIYRVGHFQTEVIIDAYYGHLMQVDA